MTGKTKIEKRMSRCNDGIYSFVFDRKKEKKRRDILKKGL